MDALLSLSLVMIKMVDKTRYWRQPIKPAQNVIMNSTVD